jgi:hypothetical protein
MTAWRLRADYLVGCVSTGRHARTQRQSAPDGRASRSLHSVEMLDSMATACYFYLA